ncbi:protein shoot gravitropism 6 isoform X1 [Tanacetum coccineum]
MKLSLPVILIRYLNQLVRFNREAATWTCWSLFVTGKSGVLSFQNSLPFYFIFAKIFKCSGEGPDTVLEEIVDALCQHVSDDSPMVKRLCLRVTRAGLILFYFYKLIILFYHLFEMILGVILVWLADSDDSAQLTAVLCLLLVYSK